MFTISNFDKCFPIKLFNRNLLIYPNRTEYPILLVPWKDFSAFRAKYKKSPILAECTPACEDSLVEEVEKKLKTPKLAVSKFKTKFY